jgi:hypothetical protein
MAVGATKGRALGLPLLHYGPVKPGKEGTVVLNKRISLQHVHHGRLVKAGRRGYHNKNSFCEENVGMNTLQKEFFLCQGERTF